MALTQSISSAVPLSVPPELVDIGGVKDCTRTSSPSSLSKGEIVSLKHETHPWPASFMAATSRLLDDAGIPNVLWGDLLYWWRGGRHVPTVCGLVVASEQLNAAINIVERAGLLSCHCEETIHLSDPKNGYWLPTHFRIQTPYGFQQTLFLCPSDLLLNLIPLNDSDANPLELSFDRYIVHLYEECHPVGIPSAAQLPSPTFQSLRVMTTVSLIKLAIILCTFHPHIGVDLPFLHILLQLSHDDQDQGPYTLQSSSLQCVWDKLFVFMTETDPRKEYLWDGVRSEWKDKLKL